MDLDVEVLKKFDDLLELPYFMGIERYELTNAVEAAVLGTEKIILFFYVVEIL